jgi:hypothetical protein
MISPINLPSERRHGASRIAILPRTSIREAIVVYEIEQTKGAFGTGRIFWRRGFSDIAGDRTILDSASPQFGMSTDREDHSKNLRGKKNARLMRKAEAMDDLDKIVLKVALSIVQGEAEAPGSQPLRSVRLAEEIVAHLQQADNELPKTRTASGE